MKCFKSYFKTLFFAILFLGASAGGLMAQPGQLDPSFNSNDPGFNAPAGGANAPVYAIVQQLNKKIIVGGSFTAYNGEAVNYLLRLNEDGSRDQTFNAGQAGPGSQVRALAIQPDGKILVGGNFSSYNGVAAKYVVRLNTDGSRDATFDGSAAEYSNVYTFCLQPDGKILVGSQSRPPLTRLNVNGTVDTSFHTNINSANPIGPLVSTVALQSDGKIIVGGAFGFMYGVSVRNLVRLNSNGSRDTTFNAYRNEDDEQVVGGPDSYVYRSLVKPDGKIIIGGSFTLYLSIVNNAVVSNSARGIARLNTDGTLDNSFNQGGTGFPVANNSINDLALQQDGKILVGGTFTSYNGSAASNLLRLNADGSLDTFAGPGVTSPASSGVNAISLEAANTRFLIGGSFTSYNNTGRNRIARIYASDCTYSNISGPSRSCNYTVASGNTASYSVTGPVGSVYSWIVSNPATMQIISGQNTNSIQLQYANNFTSGIIYVRITNAACGFTVKPLLTVNSNPPAAPGIITPGNANVCSVLGTSNVVTYTISKVPGATSYNWAAQTGTTSITHPAGTGANDTTVTVSFAANFTSSAITVQAVNDCGVSSVRSLNISLQAAAPGEIIIQNAGVCPNRTYTYSLNPAVLPANATNIVWTVPAGGTIISGQGAVTLIVSYSSSAVTGFVTARGANDCTLSNARKLAVSLPVCRPAPPTLFAKGLQMPEAKNAELEVKIYPDPSPTSFNLVVAGDAKQKVQLRILDIAGRYISSQSVPVFTTLQFGNDLKPGSYLAEITQGNNKKILRFIKL